MKNNRLLSSLLLVSVATSLVAGVLSLQKNRYVPANADLTYKVIYLSIPGPDEEHKGQVTKTNGSDPIIWDKDDDLYFYTFSGSYPGNKMSKIDDHLYAYHAYRYTGSKSEFIFTANVGVNNYRCAQDGIVGFKYNQVDSSHNLFRLDHYNTDDVANCG